MSKCVYSHLDYNDGVVDVTFTKLFEFEMAARFFIAKPLIAQKRYLNKLTRELNLDDSTSKSNHASNTTSTK